MAECRVVVILGPTGTGKTALALEVCRSASALLINADSVQVYRGFDIGSAKPTAAEMEGVETALFDVCSPDDTYTAGRFLSAARALVVGRERACVVGGSGFYVRAFETGMYDVPEVGEPLRREIIQEIETAGSAALHLWIAERDPTYSRRIDPNDAYRVGRAVGLMRQTGRSMSDIQSEMRREREHRRYPGPMLKIGLEMEREELRRGVEERTRQMLKSGLIEEVRGLVESGYGDSWALRTIGYRETRLFLEGQLTLEELPRIIVQNTMQLAKRQRTWFRRDAEVMWVHPVRDRARVIGRMREWWRAAEEVGAARNARSRQDVKN